MRKGSGLFQLAQELYEKRIRIHIRIRTSYQWIRIPNQGCGSGMIFFSDTVRIRILRKFRLQLQIRLRIRQKAPTTLSPTLSLFITFPGADNEDTPQYKLTGFTVYDKAGHAVPFDTDLIESGKEIFFSGFLKNVFAEVTLSTH